MAQDDFPPLPPDWEIRECKDYPGRCYFYNSLTSASTWLRPGADPEQIFVSQILIKTEKSVNPVKRGTPVKVSVDEARSILEDAREQLESDLAKFGQLADDITDMEDNTTGGVLGWIRREDVPREFAEAAWRLKPNELSGIVESPLGLHLILRLQ